MIKDIAGYVPVWRFLLKVDSVRHFAHTYISLFIIWAFVYSLFTPLFEDLCCIASALKFYKFGDQILYDWRLITVDRFFSY